jgi:hypothetical protein
MTPAILRLPSVIVGGILGHTSISFQIERDKNDGLVASNCGTSLKMINRHYREVIEESEAVERFWALTPNSIRSLDISFENKPTPRKTVQWPSDKKLLEMVNSMPMTQVGKAIGVSDTAVRKRMKARGLEMA